MNDNRKEKELEEKLLGLASWPIPSLTLLKMT